MDYKKKARVDLHIHSNASDGTFSPEEIISLAGKLGLQAISITDHDTLEGSRQAHRIYFSGPLKLITGVEISADLPSEAGYKGSCHILGYGVDVNDATLNDTLALLQNARKNRNPRILEKLNALGIPLTLDEVMQSIPDQQAGRPHIARQLVEKGFAASISEAFDRYIGVGQPAYVDKFRLSCTKAVESINHAGGVAVLAHPYLLQPNTGKVFENLLMLLITRGLAGIEVYYPEHSWEMTRYYQKIAEELGLLVTGGSDFHGALKPEIQMGYGSGDLHVPLRAYEYLETVIQQRHR